MKKYAYLFALLISACASPEDIQRRKAQFAADIEAIGQDGQTGYFACLFDDDFWNCRQAIWEKKPKPHLPGHEKQDFVRRYLDAAERRGAANVLKVQKQPCGEVKALNHYMWRDGQYAECTDGHEYQILKDGDRWRVTLQQGGE